MIRPLSGLGPALTLAAATLAASAVVAFAPRSSPVALAGPFLLVVALVGSDLVATRRAGRPRRIAGGTLVLAGSIALASASVAGDGRHLAAMMPVFGSCAAVALVTRDAGSRPRCGSPTGSAGEGLP